VRVADQVRRALAEAAMVLPIVMRGMIEDESCSAHGRLQQKWHVIGSEDRSGRRSSSALRRALPLSNW